MLPTIQRALLALLLATTATPLHAQDAQLPGPTLAGDSEVVELSLDDAIALAEERSFRIARARRNEAMADLRHDVARSGYYPRADVRAIADQSARGFRYASDQFESEQPIGGEFRAGLNGNVTMPIDLFGAVKRQVRQADLIRQIAGNDLAQADLDVLQDVQANYLNASRAQNQVDADEAVVTQIAGLLARAQSAAPSTASFLEVELGNAQQSLTNSRSYADQAQDGLKQSLRLPPDIRLRLTTKFIGAIHPIDREGLLDRAIAARPEIANALLRIRQAETATKQVGEYRRPSLSAGAFYSDTLSADTALLKDHDRFRNQSVGLNFTLPIGQYDHGALRAQKQIARIQEDQAAADAEELRERIGYELRQAMIAVQRAESRLATLPDRAQAREALDRAEDQMLAAGPTDALALLAQVSNARYAWRSAETASQDAYVDYYSALYRLARTLGLPLDDVVPGAAVSRVDVKQSGAS